MRRILSTLVIIFGLTSSAWAEDAKQDFTLANHTGYELKEVYVSPAKSDDWQEDVLGTGTLKSGKAIEIKFHRSTKTCHWDLKVVYTDDDSNAVWHNIDLCSIDKITIHYDKEKDSTSATFD